MNSSGRPCTRLQAAKQTRQQTAATEVPATNVSGMHITRQRAAAAADSRGSSKPPSQHNTTTPGRKRPLPGPGCRQGQGDSTTSQGPPAKKARAGKEAAPAAATVQGSDDVTPNMGSALTVSVAAATLTPSEAAQLLDAVRSGRKSMQQVLQQLLDQRSETAFLTFLSYAVKRRQAGKVMQALAAGQHSLLLRLLQALGSSSTSSSETVLQAATALHQLMEVVEPAAVLAEVFSMVEAVLAADLAAVVQPLLQALVRALQQLHGQRERQEMGYATTSAQLLFFLAWSSRMRSPSSAAALLPHTGELLSMLTQQQQQPQQQKEHLNALDTMQGYILLILEQIVGTEAGCQALAVLDLAPLLAAAGHGAVIEQKEVVSRIVDGLSSTAAGQQALLPHMPALMRMLQEATEAAAAGTPSASRSQHMHLQLARVIAGTVCPICHIALSGAAGVQAVLPHVPAVLQVLAAVTLRSTQPARMQQAVLVELDVTAATAVALLLHIMLATPDGLEAFMQDIEGPVNTMLAACAATHTPELQVQDELRSKLWRWLLQAVSVLADAPSGRRAIAAKPQNLEVLFVALEHSRPEVAEAALRAVEHVTVAMGRGVQVREAHPSNSPQQGIDGADDWEVAQLVEQALTPAMLRPLLCVLPVLPVSRSLSCLLELCSLEKGAVYTAPHLPALRQAVQTLPLPLSFIQSQQEWRQRMQSLKKIEGKVAAVKERLQQRLVQAQRDMQQAAVRSAEVYGQYRMEPSSVKQQVLAIALMQQLAVAAVLVEDTDRALAMMHTG